MNSSIPQRDYIDEAILINGMQAQLSKWQLLLESGHKRLGWKIGFNTPADQTRLRLPYPIVGFLTSESLLDSGSTYIGKKSSKLMAEAEVAILIGKAVPADATRSQLTDAISGFAPAIEIVDIARASHDVTSILEDNIFHESVIFGELSISHPELNAKDIIASVTVNGEVVQSGDSSRYPDDIRDVVAVVANTLAKQGKCLEAGDWIISGSITQPVEVFAGDILEVILAPLGSLSLKIEK